MILFNSSSFWKYNIKYLHQQSVSLEKDPMLFHMDGGVRSSQISATHDVFSVTVSNSANDRSKISLSGSTSAVRTGAYPLLDLCKQTSCMYTSRTWPWKMLTHSHHIKLLTYNELLWSIIVYGILSYLRMQPVR
jgi:hypothetical protein